VALFVVRPAGLRRSRRSQSSGFRIPRNLSQVLVTLVLSRGFRPFVFALWYRLSQHSCMLADVLVVLTVSRGSLCRSLLQVSHALAGVFRSRILCIV
jgi:hypothetical protein